MSDDDRRMRLEVLRDQLAVALELAEPNMLPQLAGQYRATLADLAGLPVAVVVVTPGGKDDLKQRRADRLAKAAPVASAGRGGAKRGA